MKTKITIEVNIEMSEYKNIDKALMDIAHYINQGEQYRESTFAKADYVYYIHVPVRKGARVIYSADKTTFIHKSKIT